MRYVSSNHYFLFAYVFKPFLHTHLSINVNFMSDFESLKKLLRVKAWAELKGYADSNADVMTVMDSATEMSAAGLDDLFKNV